VTRENNHIEREIDPVMFTLYRQFDDHLAQVEPGYDVAAGLEKMLSRLQEHPTPSTMNGGVTATTGEEPGTVGRFPAESGSPNISTKPARRRAPATSRTIAGLTSAAMLSVLFVGAVVVAAIGARAGNFTPAVVAAGVLTSVVTLFTRTWYRPKIAGQAQNSKKKTQKQEAINRDRRRPIHVRGQ
jgi:hypothetical protein